MTGSGTHPPDGTVLPARSGGAARLLLLAAVALLVAASLARALHAAGGRHEAE